MTGRLPLLALFLIALTLRLGVALTRDASDAAIAPLPDQREYLDLGRSILSGNGLAMVDPRFNDVARAFRMPGYPLFVAACGGRVTIVRVVQSILDASTVLAVVWLARRWLAPGAALIAGVFVAFDPIQVYFSSLILSETLFVTLLAWGLAIIVNGRSPISVATPGERKLWIAGVAVLIASVYVRPSAIAFPTLLVFAAAIAEARGVDFVPDVRRWPVVTLTVLATLLALLPWAARNKLVLDRWIVTTTNDGFTLYDGWHRSATGASDQSVLTALPLLPNLTETQRSDYLRELAIRDASADPMRLLRLVPTKLARTWSPWPLSDAFGGRRAYVVIAAVHAIPLFALAFVGLFVRNTLPRTAKFLLIVPALAITVMHAASVGSLRYRLPAHATLAVLAASALAMRRPAKDRVESSPAA